MPDRRSCRYSGLGCARSGGFATAELLVVLVVTAALVLIVIVSLNGIDRDAGRSDCLSQRRALRVAAEQFRADFGFHPPDNAALVSAGVLGRDEATDWKVVTVDQSAGPVFKPSGNRCADV